MNYLKRNKYTILFLMIIAVLFNSCILRLLPGDPYSTLNFYIKNESSDTIYVEVPHGNLDNDPPTTQAAETDRVECYLILPNSTFLILTTIKVGWPNKRDVGSIKSPLRMSKKHIPSSLVFNVEGKTIINVQTGQYTRIIKQED